MDEALLARLWTSHDLQRVVSNQALYSGNRAHDEKRDIGPEFDPILKGLLGEDRATALFDT